MNDKIFIEIIESGGDINAQAIQILKSKDIEYVTNEFGIFADLFGKDCYYAITTETVQKGKYCCILADTGFVYQPGDQLKLKTELAIYEVDPLKTPTNFWDKLERWGVYYFSDGETFWLGDHFEADNFESFLESNHIDCWEKVA